MLTIFTIMLILYAQKMLLLCSKSPTIMLKIFPPDHPFFTAILEIGSQPHSRPTWPRPLPLVKSEAVDCRVYFSTVNHESQFRDCT